jgi:hypothetical protein
MRFDEIAAKAREIAEGNFDKYVGESPTGRKNAIGQHSRLDLLTTLKIADSIQ